MECSTEHLSLVFTDQLIQLTPLMLRRPPVTGFLHSSKLINCLCVCSVVSVSGVSCRMSQHVPGHNEDWPLLLCPLPCPLSTVQCLPRYMSQYNWFGCRQTCSHVSRYVCNGIPREGTIEPSLLNRDLPKSCPPVNGREICLQNLHRQKDCLVKIHEH